MGTEKQNNGLGGLTPITILTPITPVALFGVLLVVFLVAPVRELYGATLSIQAGYVIALLPPLILTAIIFSMRYRRYRSNASRDFMLGCYNQRECDEQLRRTLSEFKRKACAPRFSVLLCDIDGLGAVNKVSRSSADGVLKDFTALLHSEKRETDLFYRYVQGDEFMFILRDTDAAGARVFAERIRKRTEQHPFNIPKALQITVCIGVKCITPEDVYRSGAYTRENELPVDLAINALKQKVENALAKAKDHPGKNRVEEYQDQHLQPHQPSGAA
jgi:diguanylate cyclase (GGDEF)-like protein